MTTETKAIAIIPRTVEEVKDLSRIFAMSSLLPPELRGKEADVFVSIVAGQELGLPPMASLRGVHVVKGKPVLAAATMVGVVLAKGLAEYFTCVEDTPERATYITKRRGSPREQSCTWTMADARTAGLANGDNWKKFPRAMLQARCKAMLARDVYPDVLAGCYDPSELDETATPEVTSPASAFASLPGKVIEATASEPAPASSPPTANTNAGPSPIGAAPPAVIEDWKTKLRAPQTKKALREVAAALNGIEMTRQQRDELLDIYREQWMLIDEAEKAEQAGAA